MGTTWTVFWTILCLSFNLQFSDGASTMAIDLGSDFTKVAVVLPGVPMEIALDSSSKRSIPTLVLLREGNRLFGNSAVASMTREPKIVFAELPSIIGKTIDHPVVVAYKQRYPYHDLVFSSESNQLAFVVNGREFTAETLLAMFLEYVKQTAESFASSPMNTAIIIVPSYFTQAERRAVIRVANLANIEVIQLFGDGAAIALHYIVPRAKILEEKPDYMFIDVGATGTTVSVVSYQIAKTRGEEPGDFPHVFIRGTACDTSLGTSAFVDRLQNHLMDRFKALKKITADITKDARTVAKFRKEAVRVFKILSANKEINSATEEIYDGHDLNMKVSREQLEELTDDLVARLSRPIIEALEAANIPVTSIKEVILFGGGSRIPAVQSAILKATQKTSLAKSINADEAAAMGAIYQAAYRTVGFRVKRIVIREVNRYPIAVTFPRIPTEDDEKEGTAAATDEMVTRVLFPTNIAFPQKRTIKFPRVTQDLTFRVHYDDSVSSTYKSYLSGIQDILTVDIKEVAEGLQQYESAGYRPHGIKAHLQLDDSGILRLSEVNLLMTAFDELAANKTESVSTLKKLASGISSLFGAAEDAHTGDGPTMADAETVGPSNNETAENTANAATTDDAQSNTTQSSPQNESSSSLFDDQTIPIVTTPSQKKTLVHPLAFSVEVLDRVNPPTEHLGASKAILREYEMADNERRKLERIRNTLEASIFSTRELLDDSTFLEHTIDAERNSLSHIVTEISQWFDDEGFDSPISTFEEHVDKLNDALSPLKRRIAEFSDLPGAMEMFENVLNKVARPLIMAMQLNSAEKAIIASDYVASLNETVNGTFEVDKLIGLPIYYTEEVNSFEKLVAEEEKWLKESKEAFKASDLKADPPVRLAEVKDRADKVSGKVSYFSQKGENWLVMYRRLVNIKNSIAAAAAAKAKAEAEEQTKANQTEPAGSATGASDDSASALETGTDDEPATTSTETADGTEKESMEPTTTPKAESTPRQEL